MLNKYRNFISSFEEIWRKEFGFYSIYELAFVNELIDFIDYAEVDFPDLHSKIQDYIDKNGEDTLIRNFVAKLLDLEYLPELGYESVKTILEEILENN